MTEHIRSLDGVRGLAVALVVLFHLGLLAPGWIGVQIFFVLSGFLITGILLREKERPFREYLGRFYWRRSLRIFPLYFLFLAGASAVYFTTGEPKSFAVDWPYLVSYTANFGRLRTADVGQPFVHLWSLAVEEQFYLLWPLLVYFLPLPAFKRAVIAILILTPVVRLGLYFAFQGHEANWIGRSIYSLPFSQFDAFAAGAAIVLWRDRAEKNARARLALALAVSAAAGFAMLLHAYFNKTAYVASLGFPMYLMPGWGFVWGYSLLNVTSALIIVCAIKYRWFESRALVYLGSISYGVYVYHVPIIEMIGRDHSVICAIVTLGVAAVSRKWLEQPFLSLKEWSLDRPKKPLLAVVEKHNPIERFEIRQID